MAILFRLFLCYYYSKTKSGHLSIPPVLINVKKTGIIYSTRTRSSVDRASGFGPECRGFESLRVCHFGYNLTIKPARVETPVFLRGDYGVGIRYITRSAIRPAVSSIVFPEYFLLFCLFPIPKSCLWGNLQQLNNLRFRAVSFGHTDFGQA